MPVTCFVLYTLEAFTEVISRAASQNVIGILLDTAKSQLLSMNAVSFFPKTE